MTQIKEIRVSYKETCSMPNYNNVSVEVGYTLDLSDEEYAPDGEAALIEVAKKSVQKQIDDTLEENGQSPKYSTDPRFSVLFNPSLRAVAVVPAGSTIPTGDYTGTMSVPNRLRYTATLAGAQRFANQRGYTLYDCADGDFSRLPQSEDIPF
jgi:hypothetical protein